MNVTIIMARESIARPTPITRLSVLALALLAKIAETAAPKRVNTMQRTKINGLVIPLFMAKCETEPVKAVKVIMKTLVPTAVLSS